MNEFIKDLPKTIACLIVFVGLPIFLIVRGPLEDAQIKSWAREAGFTEDDSAYIFSKGERYTRDNVFELKAQSENNFKLSDEAAHRLAIAREWRFDHRPVLSPVELKRLLHESD